MSWAREFESHEVFIAFVDEVQKALQGTGYNVTREAGRNVKVPVKERFRAWPTPSPAFARSPTAGTPQD